MMEDLRPRAVVAVGLVGHSDLETEGEIARAVEARLGTILRALQRGAVQLVERDACFEEAAPKVYLMATAGEGAAVIGAHAATKCGWDLACVTPFFLDGDPESSPSAPTKVDAIANEGAGAAQGVLALASSRLELPGCADEGPRALERANDAVLANVDLLLAVWDGHRSRRRAGVGDVVQTAVNRGIPVVVVEPRAPDAPATILVAPDPHVEPAIVVDLPRVRLPEDLAGLLGAVIGPPRKLTKRRGLLDLLSEKPRSAAWRIEYPLLLRIGAGRSDRLRTSNRAATDGAGDEPSTPSAAQVDRVRRAIDQLAVRYGRLYRSSAVSSYFLAVLVACVSGTVGLLVPALSSASIAVQAAVYVLVMIDARLSRRRRWQERWLDYRVIAERLRWLKFLHPFGLGAGAEARAPGSRDASWTDWYVRRIARGLGPPTGTIDAAALEAAAERLRATEIRDQIAFHRRTFRQLSRLDIRLSGMARASLLAAIALAALLGVTALSAVGYARGWRPAATQLLSILPAIMVAFNGIRAQTDLARLVERSAQTIAVLSRIRRRSLSESLTYDRVAACMLELAARMANELMEWRFVLESRRSRQGRLARMGKKRFRRVLSRLRRPSGG